jgi:hypothetical protein
MDQSQNYGVPSGNTPGQGQTQTQGISDVKNQSMQYMNYHVIGQMSDGSQVEGIIEEVDDEGVTMLVPENIEADERIFGGYGGFGGYGRRRFRRFRRRRFPFSFFIFPFFFPFPYYY